MTAKILEFKKKNSGDIESVSSKEEISFNTIFDCDCEKNIIDSSFEEKKKKMQEERRKNNESVLRSYRIK